MAKTLKENAVPYWYNVDTKAVETDETRSQNTEVLGPYATEEEARNALETARARNEAWDREDKEWDEKNAAPGWSDDDLED